MWQQQLPTKLVFLRLLAECALVGIYQMLRMTLEANAENGKR